MDEDPKQVAKEARRLPETEKALRQFLNLDGPKGTTEKYRENYDLVFRGADCYACKRRFVKTDMKEIVAPVVGYVCKDCFCDERNAQEMIESSVIPPTR